MKKLKFLLFTCIIAMNAMAASIWTTNKCAQDQQDKNHYKIGETVYVAGEDFDPLSSYSWTIKGNPGGSSCDPNTIVASGTIITDENGDFCFAAYIILNNDCGTYSVDVSQKNDNYVVDDSVAIRIVKYVNGEDANTPPGLTLTVGTPITWRYVITNTGNIPLSDITVTDNKSVTPIYQSGDINNDGILDTDETWLYEAYGIAEAGQYENIGTAIGYYNDYSVQDDDTSHYFAEFKYDFGDAPDPTYPTLLSSNGARHLISQLYLGNTIDAEPNGLPHAALLGDDLDGTNDEDGVTFPNLPLIQNKTNVVSVLSSGDGFLNAWIDFNADGDWNDSSEHIINDFPVTAGSNSITFVVPLINLNSSPMTVTFISRFRLSSNKGIGIVGLAPDGEVEDYSVDIYVPVELSSFTARIINGDIVLSWTTQSESDNLGFCIFRSETIDGRFDQISTQIIMGAGTSGSMHSYSFIDNDVVAGHTYYYKLADVSFDGSFHMHPALKITVDVPSENSLAQNYPNPFNSETIISFKIKQDSEISLMIFNVNGRIVRTLVSGKHHAGYHHLRWNACDDSGTPLPSGRYICVFRANEFTKVLQITYIK
ncbi:T9SS type A sorting domain-containing protein [candidate division KSB1 bacterium]|nr:T9SS type A sorting domain-containing protein [candidate division KSB1 bacterium]